MDLNRRGWFANLAMSAVACATMAGCNKSQVPRESDELDSALVPNPEKPLTLFWNGVKLQDVVVHQRRWTAIQRFLALPFPESRYQKLHWLRFFGPFFRLASKTTDDFALPGSDTHHWKEWFDQFLSELTDSEVYEAVYHERLHLRTRHGVAFLTAEEQAARAARFADPHPNKILSVFALSGLGMDHELKIDGERLTVADCVRCASRDCDLRSELSWTISALCHYLPPTTAWRDKSEATLSFDRIVTRLCETPLESDSCFGHHIPIALVTVLRACQHHDSLIQPQSHRHIRRKLQKYCVALRTTQLRDGSWPSDWTGRNSVKDGDSFKARFISTSHALEWLSYVARGSDEMTAVRDAAEDWLCQTLFDLNGFELLKYYDSAAHAAFGLMCLFEKNVAGEIAIS